LVRELLEDWEQRLVDAPDRQAYDLGNGSPGADGIVERFRDRAWSGHELDALSALAYGDEALAVQRQRRRRVDLVTRLMTGCACLIALRRLV
jgi:hypothetical protein